MDELGPLSSQLRERTEAANRAAAGRCLANPALLAEVGAGLSRKEANLVGDSAEVMTKVAEVRPELIAPYSDKLATLLEHKVTRVRWESVHALALTAHLVPERIAQLLPRLGGALASDPSTIVRDYGVEALGSFAGTGPEPALLAFPYLKTALAAAGGKHAARALAGLAKAGAAAPDLRAELHALAQLYLGHERPSVRKAARQLARAK